MIARRVVDDDDDDDDLVCRFLLCVPVRLIVLGDDRWISVAELPGIYHFMDSIIGTQGWKENCWIW